MATFPESDFFRDGRFGLSAFLPDCDKEQSAQAPNFQGGNRQLLDHSEMKETEDLLASEFNKLSVQERSKALDDVHCVGEELEETPEMIEQALKEFDEMVRTTANQIYNVALNQNRAYVEDRSFRLKFLRANMFNIKKSVQQMMNFLKQKALYFGEQNVARDIVPGDMDSKEIALLRSGIFQILKDRDRNGRVVFYNSTQKKSPVDDYTAETLIRVLYHVIFNVLLAIPSVQTKGIVAICYDECQGESQSFPGFAYFAKVNSFAAELPIRASSIHICIFSSPGSLALHNKIARVSLKAMSDLALTRTRLHYGSDMERQYELRGFGIPLENFPVDKNGNLRDEIHKTLCDEYVGNNAAITGDEQQRPRNKSTHNGMSCILETDVLFGRGRMVQNHAGNIRFRQFLDERAQEYDNLPRHYRMAARIGYTQELVSSGTRFLKQNQNDLWVACDFDEAVRKVCQFFRTRRRDRKLGEAGIRQTGISSQCR